MGPAKCAQLQAVLEMARRALGEEMRRGIGSSSPAAVRDYLRLPLGGLQHEVFFALWLDAQNRLIASARAVSRHVDADQRPSASRNSPKPELMHQASPLASTAGYNPGVLFRSVARPSENKYGGQGRQQPQTVVGGGRQQWQFNPASPGGS
jgi:hypothetical protein